MKAQSRLRGGYTLGSLELEKQEIMNAHPPDTADIFLHVVSVELTPPGFDPDDQDDEPVLEDMGTGMEWGIDAARTLAFTRKRECWLIVPETSEIVFKARPADIVLH